MCGGTDGPIEVDSFSSTPSSSEDGTGYQSMYNPCD